MSLVSLWKGRGGPSGFGYASTAQEVTRGVDLSGKTVLVTGVNSGLGLESARVLAMRGARVLAAARTAEKARDACRTLAGDFVPLACELSEPASVRACADEVLRLGRPVDVVLCNAGIMALPERTIVHGQELQFLTNHVGHFVLVRGLLDALAEEARVVVVSSAAHTWAPAAGIQFDDLTLSRGYSGRSAYGQSKLANILFARSLARRFAGSRKTANSLHPGVIPTNLSRHSGPLVRIAKPLASAIALKTIAEGAATQCYVAAHPRLEGVSGEYFSDCNVARSSAHGRDDAMAERLWDVTEKIADDLSRAPS
jgi:WW domain-containing oxidoreductase